MKFDLTKDCADSLRTFAQNNYGIQLKSSHAHEIVSAYFGYSSRAALIADKKCSIGNLKDAKIIIPNTPILLVEHRLRTLEKLPSGLPASDVLAEGIYAPITNNEKLSNRIWADFQTMAIAYAEDRVFDNEKMERMMGIDEFDQRELDWLIQVDIKSLVTDVLMIVTYDYPAKAKKAMRHASVAITLPRIAGNIGYGEPKVVPTFYSGHMSDPDFRLKHGID